MLNQSQKPEMAGERCDFDRLVDRGGTDSLKWNRYEGDVLPLWVADMDFLSPQPVIAALRERVDHGVFGYSVEPPALRGVVQQHLQERYRWSVEPADLLFLPGTVVGLNLTCHAVGRPGDDVLIQTPIYPPFYSAPRYAGCQPVAASLVYTERGYEIDFDAFEQAITPRTRLFLLCNPHNPTGRVFTSAELERLAEICIRHDLIICSDEIHKDFVFDSRRHVPIASLGPEVAGRTVTLLAPSKTYNIPGLHLSIAHTSNPDLLRRLKAAQAGLVGGAGNLLSYVAALAAYKHGGEWLAQLLDYLQANRDFAAGYLRGRLPGVRLFDTEGTYLAWLDCRGMGLDESPAEFFLREARVGLSEGTQYGVEGTGFVRLNFGCPRAMLSEALDRMSRAI